MSHPLLACNQGASQSSREFQIAICEAVTSTKFSAMLWPLKRVPV